MNRSCSGRHASPFKPKLFVVHARNPGSAEYVAGPWRYERLDGPGHWMQLEAPDKVSELILGHLRAHPIA